MKFAGEFNTLIIALDTLLNYTLAIALISKFNALCANTRICHYASNLYDYKMISNTCDTCP